MLQMHRLISRLISKVFSGLGICLTLISLVGVGCSSPPVKPPSLEQGIDKDGQSYYTRVIYYPFELVWRAAQLSVKYPISVNNMDNGLLETEWIKSLDGFSSPLETTRPTAGYRYKLAVNMVKGKVDSRPSVRVTIRKKIERQKDFFSDTENINSDGLEEKVILYRIEREIIIDEAIKKSTKALK